MNRSEFIKRVIKEKGINKTIYLLSKNVVGFPKARKVLNLIDRNTMTSKIINSKNIKEIKEAKELLLIHEINYIQDDNLRNQTKKFIDDLVEEKILQKFLNSLNVQENKKTNYIEGSNSWENRDTNNEEDEEFNEAMYFIALVIILFFILIFFANLN